MCMRRVAGGVLERSGLGLGHAGHGMGSRCPNWTPCHCPLSPHPEVSLVPHPDYPKAPPKLWTLLSDGSHRSHIIWWGILLRAQSGERRQLAANGAPQNAAVRCQCSALGSLDHADEGIVESIR